MTLVNGIDTEELRGYIAAVADRPARADRDPTVVARWVGASRSEVSFVSGEAAVHIGGEGEPSAMKMLLACLAACDVDLVATRAALLGVELEDLSVVATGHFHVRRYLGMDAPDGPGYRRMSYTVRVKARNASPDQLAELRRACEQDSPVGDTLQGAVAVTFAFESS